MTDDNVIKFTGPQRAVTFNHGKTVLIKRSDGTFVRGSDGKPLIELTAAELIPLIEELCDLIARR